MVKRIFYRFCPDEDALFGDTNADIDVQASINEFESQLWDALSKVYSDASITIERGPAACWVNGDKEHDEVYNVETIAADLWQSWTWLVPAENPITDLEIAVSYDTIIAITGWNEDKVEAEEFNIDTLLQDFLQREFEDSNITVSAVSGAFDFIDAYNEAGDKTKAPAEIVERITSCIEKALAAATEIL